MAKKIQSFTFCRQKLETLIVGFSDMVNLMVGFLLRLFDFQGLISPFSENQANFLRIVPFDGQH